MKINGIDTETYKATLLDRHIENAEIITNQEWADNWISPVIEGQNIKYVAVQCEFEINCKTDDEAEKNISNILALGKLGELEFEDLSTKYHGFIENKSDEKIIQGKYILNITWKCALGYESQITKTILNNNTITLSSTAETPVVLQIIPTEDIAELEILGFGEDIILKNLTEGIEVIIDGEKGLITEEGQNKFQDYNSWGFPKLFPGNNEISINGNVEIIAKYSPRWL